MTSEATTKGAGATEPTLDSKDCSCMAELVRRTAKAIPPAPWSRDLKWDLPAVAGLLGGLDEEEAELVAKLGVLKSVDGSRWDGPKVPAEALLRFLEQHGATWFQARMEQQIEHLREIIAAAKRRSEREAEAAEGQEPESAQ